MGGANQSLAHAQFVSNLVDYGMNIQAALSEPRFTVRPTEQGIGCDIMIESRVPAETLTALEQKGHKFKVRKEYSTAMRNNVDPDGSSREAGGKDGILHRIDPDAGLSVHRRDIGISNTLVWSPDQRRFYFGDSLANTIWSYDYDRDTGAIQNEAVFFAGFGRGLPDGSTVDADGYLWNCRYDGGCIVRLSPDGEIDRVIEMPVRKITTCTFGGADLTTLFVTTASVDAAPGERLAGGLFAIQCEVSGQKENRFRVFGI